MPYKHYLGLDIGSSGTKAIVLDKSGSIVSSGVLDMKAEGILNETELYASIFDWMEREHWKKCCMTAGIPQYMTTILARNYPEKLPRKAIMLQLESEASQVAGLSDEPMLQDGCILGKTCMRTNAVVIGISREQNIRERLGAMVNAGIHPADLVPGGIALANAFYHFHPEQLQSCEPVLLLELGNENSTAVVLAGGQPLFISSLLFSAEKINETIKRRGAEHKVTVEERDMRSINLQDENSHSSVMEALFAFENEIQSFVESWRAQEAEDLMEKPIAEVHICGGLSQMRGLSSWLQERLEVPVSILAPLCDNIPHPELTLAYGLALQMTGKVRLHLSLLPQDVKDERLRIRNLPVLISTLLFMFFALTIIDVRLYLSAKSQIGQAKARRQEVNQCSRVAAEILSLQKQLHDKENMVLPLVIAGNQNRCLWQIADCMGKANATKDWFIYLADEESYHQSRENRQQSIQPRKRTSANLFGEKNTIGDTTNADEFPICINPAELKPSSTYIAAGYTPQIPQEPYAPVKEILSKMEKSGQFTKTDILPENERIGREDIFIPWVDFLKKIRGGQFKAFTVRLPLSNPVIKSGEDANNENGEEEE